MRIKTTTNRLQHFPILMNVGSLQRRLRKSHDSQLLNLSRMALSVLALQPRHRQLLSLLRVIQHSLIPSVEARRRNAKRSGDARPPHIKLIRRLQSLLGREQLFWSFSQTVSSSWKLNHPKLDRGAISFRREHSSYAKHVSSLINDIIVRLWFNLMPRFCAKA